MVPFHSEPMVDRAISVADEIFCRVISQAAVDPVALAVFAGEVIGLAAQITKPFGFLRISADACG